MGEVLVAALDALEQGDLLATLGGAMVKKLSKTEQARRDLAASDLTAQGAEREDIEYGSHETLPQGQHVARLGNQPRPPAKPTEDGSLESGTQAIAETKGQVTPIRC
jgi:hypothetical protein